jgi:large conductance mechanosensitive channel
MAKKEKKTLKEELKELNKKNKGFWAEFKTFIARGNVMDLAVGVIVGTAFTNIVKSLTDNILMPIIGLVIGGFDFTKLAFNVEVWGREVAINYGSFIQSTVDFLLTALCIFIIIKLMNKFTAKKEEEKKEEKPAEPVKSDEVKLLEEIRDLLKENKKTTK